MVRPGKALFGIDCETIWLATLIGFPCGSMLSPLNTEQNRLALQLINLQYNYLLFVVGDLLDTYSPNVYWDFSWAPWAYQIQGDDILRHRLLPSLQSGPAHPERRDLGHRPLRRFLSGWGIATMTASYAGTCFCGAVRVEVCGEPDVMAYCHCQSCRSWSGSPVHASTIWKAEAVAVTAGAEHVATFHKTPESISHRQYLREVRRAPADPTSDPGRDRRVCGDVADPRVPSQPARQLCGDGLAAAGRPAEIPRLPQ